MASASGGASLVSALLGEVPERERRLAERCFDPRPGQRALFDVRSVLARGAVGLWLACERTALAVNARPRPVPQPTFERWDTLLSIHAERVEAPWLAVHVIAAIPEGESALLSRATVGLDRRFGERWARALRARLEAHTVSGPEQIEALLATRAVGTHSDPDPCS